jgi:phage gp46-like protein
MDFNITGIDNLGVGQMTFEPSTDICNNIYLSLSIERGAWFLNTDFGLRRRQRMKNTEQNAALLREDIKDALQWLLDTGKATKITVQSELDAEDIYRLNMAIEVTQADGRIVPFKYFTEVV